MEKRAFENTTDRAMYVGGKLLQPGETREFAAHELPGELKQPAAVEATPEPTLAELMLDLLGNSVTSITAALPKLNREKLLLLQQLEGEGQKRVTLLRAIDAQLLSAANAELEAQKGVEQRAALVVAHNDLIAAKKALDDSGDTHEHPALEAAVAAAKARIDALTGGQA